MSSFPVHLSLPFLVVVFLIITYLCCHVLLYCARSSVWLASCLESWLGLALGAWGSRLGFGYAVLRVQFNLDG